MHHNVRDLVGRQYGRWTVLSYIGKSYWLCRCDCGTLKKLFTGNLTAAKSLSCGCLRDEMSRKRLTTHRLTGSVEYKVWSGMKRRCQNPHDTTFSKYGAKGITVCEKWSDSFAAFLEDMGPRPSPEHSIDRINTYKGYEPGNCRWATRHEQMRNMTSNVKLTLGGVTQTIAEWAPIVGLDQSVISYRIRQGWHHEEALTTRPWGKRHNRK